MSRARILAALGVGLALGGVARAADPTTAPATTRTAAATTQSLVTAVSVPATSPATRPTPPALPVPNEKIESALRQLSADDWKARKAAQDTLVSFGFDAVARLREVEQSADDQEVRARAGAALAQIENDAQFGATVVTLKFKDAKPEEVFAELGRQARCEFPTYPTTLWRQGPVAGPISVDLERVPFWTAFREVCRKSGVTPQQYNAEGRMALSRGPASAMDGPSVVTGPFLVVATRVHRSESIDLANPGAAVQRDFSLNVSTYVEPKVRVIQSSYNVRIDEAVDDKGNSLVVPERVVVGGMTTGRQWMWSANARLAYPAENAGKRIARIRGGMRFLVQTKADTLDVPDILKVKNAEHKVAGRRLVIKEVKANGPRYEVQMTLYRDGIAQADWNAMTYPGYPVRLLDKNGKQLASQGLSSNSGPTEMNYTWQFTRDTWAGGPNARTEEPERLVWEIPTETREMAADFLFKDLPMP